MARLEEEVDDWLHDYAASELGKGGDKANPEPPPLRLNYPMNYVLHAWSDYRMHGHWPRPGGFDAQDEALVADFQTLTRRYNWHARQLLDETGDEPRDLDIDDPILSVGRQDWQSYMGD